MASDTQPTSESADNPIVLPEKLDSAAAEVLHGRLNARHGSDVTLDATHVVRVGGRCVDLLLTARHHWRADGCTIAIVAPSEAMVADLATLGLTAQSLGTGDAP